MNIVKKIGSMTVAMTLVMGLAACEAPNWQDPTYVASQFAEGDATQQRIALGHFSKLPDGEKAKAVPALVKLYLDAGPNQKDAMEQLVQVRLPEGKAAYLAELKSNTTGYAAASADALGEIGAKEAIPDMLVLLESTDNNETKLGILQSFVYMPEPSLVGPLVNVLKLDVDAHSIALHAYACDVLAGVAQAHPDAITPEAVKQVSSAVFFANKLNQNLDMECGLALQAMRKSSEPELVKIFKGERADIQKLMMKYDKPNASPPVAFPQNHPQLIAAKRLASMRSAAAPALFRADLEEVKEAPKFVKGLAASQWRVKEGQITSEVIFGLGDLRDKEAVGVLTEILTNQDSVQKRWDDITDGFVELQLRQDAADALNRIGDRAALDALYDMADKGVVIDMERRWAMEEKRGATVDPLQRYQFNWMMALQFAYLADGAQLAKYRGLVEATSKKYPKLGEKMASFIPLIELQAECAKAGDAKAQAACYAGKLSDNKPETRAKAAWELTRLPAEVASPVLIENLGLNFPDTREILTFGIYSAPDKSAIAKIDQILKDEENKSGIEFKLDHLRLNYLKAFLKSM